jgi:hypothetical protein
MYNQATISLSKSSLFSSVYGFMRIGAVEDGNPSILHISENLSLGDDEDRRRELATNLRIVNELFFFVFGTVVQAYDPNVILPPTFRQAYKNPTFTIPIINPPPQQLSLPKYLLDLGFSFALGTHAWLWNLALQVCGAWLLLYANAFSISAFAGTFQRSNARQGLCIISNAYY